MRNELQNKTVNNKTKNSNYDTHIHQNWNTYAVKLNNYSFVKATTSVDPVEFKLKEKSSPHLPKTDGLP